MSEENNSSPQPTDDSQQPPPQLNTPSTVEPIAPAPETSDIINPTSEIKDMEVHHHTHASHGKKNWKSHFWEFLMLFLAVLCGFFAEYQLEHKIERDREKQFIKTMVEDLKTDTSKLNDLIRIRKNRIRELDTLFSLIANDEYVNNGKKLYELYDLPYWDVLRFFPSDRTMQQLKNGGNLRLIRKMNVSNALIKYDVQVRTLKEYEALQTELANQFNQHIEKLLDPVILHQAKMALVNKRLDADTIIKMDGRLNLPTDIKMQTLTAAEKKIFLKYIYQVKTIYLALRRDNILERDLAELTLALILKEYHLN